MKKEIIEEIMKECKNWRERLGLKIFAKLIVKAYNIGRINAINSALKK